MKIRAARAARAADLSAPAPAETEGGSALYYFDREVRCSAAKLLPGEYLATTRNIVLVTLLGSCVAACLRDPLAGVGGMNHFMLPGGSGGPASESARYGAYAMEVLLNELFKRGAARARIEAKLVGGGAVLRNFSANHVGWRNVEFARKYLASEGIAVAAEDVLGTQPRKVFYFPRTGQILVKHLPPTHGEVTQLEVLYQSRLQELPVPGGDVELF